MYARSLCSIRIRTWRKVLNRPFSFLKQPTIARYYSNQKNVVKSETSDNAVSIDLKTTVKETTKTASYGGIILLGIGVTGALFYAIFRELLSGKSPNSVYAKALDRCLDDDRLKLSLGEPIKGYGEETRRGRRRHVSHLLYSKDGVDHLRMKFYVKGIRRKATVHLEVRENESKDYVYRYLFVQLDDYPYTTYVLEDNRHLDPDSKTIQPILGDTDSKLLL